MAKRTSTTSTKTAKKDAAGSQVTAKPVFLAGGNPQIAKGYGDGPVEAYVAAMPGWKREIGRRLDALIERTVSRQKDVRYLDIHKGEKLDEAQLVDWVKQASRLPGQRM